MIFNKLPSRYWIRTPENKWYSVNRSGNDAAKESDKYWKEREAEVDSDED